MLKNYLKTGWKVLGRRKVFTCISLFEISFTLVVLMVVAALLDHVFAARPPEVHHERTLGIYYAEMSGPTYRRNGTAGFGLLDVYARGLANVERMSIFSATASVASYPHGARVTSYIKRTDADFWRILQFRFLEGGPYGDAEVREARPVAVINATTRDRFFGGSPAVGRTLKADGQQFTVVGVVEDVPMLRIVPFADLWVPLTTARAAPSRQELVGQYMGILLARRTEDIPGIQQEFASRLARITPTDPKLYTQVVAAPETLFEGASRVLFGQSGEREAHPERLWALLVTLGGLFMLLPTINLVNLNVSRIMERSGEIGVRKAFGATSRTLVGQFMVENVVLVALGGLVGLVLAWLALQVLSASEIIPYAEFAMNGRIFAIGMAMALVFGIVSGVYPAWRMSRFDPVQALRGGAQ